MDERSGVAPACPSCGRRGWWGNGFVLEPAGDGAISVRQYPTDPALAMVGWACRECGYEVKSPSALEANLVDLTRDPA